MFDAEGTGRALADGFCEVVLEQARCRIANRLQIALPYRVEDMEEWQRSLFKAEIKKVLEERSVFRGKRR